MTGTLPALKKVSCNLQDACDGVASVLFFAEFFATASQATLQIAGNYFSPILYF